MQPREIWSGGQTGVDRAGWDAARAHGLAINGWVPRGRLAEDGRVPARYGTLPQTATADYLERTTANVRDTDATLILYRTSLSGGTAFTHDEALRLGKPVLAVDMSAGDREDQVARIRAWLDALPGDRLNIAGPRESKALGVHDAAVVLLERVLSRQGVSVDGSPRSGLLSRVAAAPATAAAMFKKSLWEDDPDDPLPERIDVMTSLLLVLAFIGITAADRLPEPLAFLSGTLMTLGGISALGGLGRLWYLERLRVRERREAERLTKGE